jgi:hypothetical protein
MKYVDKMVQRTQAFFREMLYVLELGVGLGVGDTQAVKTHRIPRIACDTINWITAELLNLERQNSVEQRH